MRAIGPSLSAFGINNALPDTTLQLRDVNGEVVRENDDWQSHQKQELEIPACNRAILEKQLWSSRSRRVSIPPRCAADLRRPASAWSRFISFSKKPSHLFASCCVRADFFRDR